MSAIKNILLITTNFPPNPAVGTKRVSKLLKYVNHNKFCFHVLTLKEIYYDVNVGSRSGNETKIPKAVHVYRTDKSDFTSFFTFLKRVSKTIVGKKKKHSTSNQVKTKETQILNPTIARRFSSISSVLDHIRAIIFFFFEFPDKYIGWLPHALSRGISIIEAENIDVIMATAPPHSTFIMAMLLKKLTHRKLVLDFRDPWAISRWDAGNPLRYGLERFFEKLCVRNADQLYFVTQKMRDEYAKLYKKEDTQKFKLFFNGYDPDDFPQQLPELDNKDDKSPLRFVHLGTLYKRRNPEPLLLAIHELHNEGKLKPDQAQFLFIGNVVTELKFIYKKVKELHVEEFVHFLPSVSFNESIRTMFEADILLLIQPETDLQIPAKLYEYIYTKRPIFAIAEPNSATHQVLKKGNLGILAPSNDIKAIKEALMDFCNRKIHLEPDENYIQNFNFQTYIAEFEKNIQSL